MDLFWNDPFSYSIFINIIFTNIAVQNVNKEFVYITDFTASQINQLGVSTLPLTSK